MPLETKLTRFAAVTAAPEGHVTKVSKISSVVQNFTNCPVFNFFILTV